MHSSITVAPRAPMLNTPRCLRVAIIPPSVSRPLGVRSVPEDVRSHVTYPLASPGAVIVSCGFAMFNVALVLGPVYCNVKAFGKTKYWCETLCETTSQPALIHD